MTSKAQSELSSTRRFPVARAFWRAVYGGVQIVIFAMDQNQQKSLVQLYMERRKNNTLPEPIHLDVRFKHKEEKEENTIEKDLKSVFPDLIIKED